jgi:hypothetical protein
LGREAVANLGRTQAWKQELFEKEAGGFGSKAGEFGREASEIGGEEEGVR